MVVLVQSCVRWVWSLVWGFLRCLVLGVRWGVWRWHRIIWRNRKIWGLKSVRSLYSLGMFGFEKDLKDWYFRVIFLKATGQVSKFASYHHSKVVGFIFGWSLGYRLSYGYPRIGHVLFYLSVQFRKLQFYATSLWLRPARGLGWGDGACDNGFFPIWA